MSNGRAPKPLSAAGVETFGRRVAVALVLAIAVPGAYADELAFARSKKCMNCHAMADKLVGPAYRAVAARYATDKDAEPRLAKKIREGSAGAWGNVPMPANPDVTAADAERLARWVLSSK